jgi:hypothetical protein
MREGGTLLNNSITFSRPLPLLSLGDGGGVLLVSFAVEVPDALEGGGPCFY